MTRATRFRRLAIVAAMAAAVTGHAFAQPQLVVPIHPSPDEFLTPEEFFVLASVFLPDSAVLSPPSVEIFIDGTPAAGSVELTETVLKWFPDSLFLLSEDLYGNHTIRCELKSTPETIVASGQWAFTLLRSSEAGPPEAAQKRRAWQNGRVYGEMGQYLLNGHSDWEFAVGGLYRGGVGAIRYSAETHITNLNNIHTQDRNTYRLSLKLGKYLDIKAIDTRPYLNPLVLSGQRIRGIQAGAHLIFKSGQNPLNFDFAWGQARRAVQPYHLSDSTLCSGSYARNILAGRVSFGSGRICQLGVMFLKGRDDTSSIERLRDTLVAPDSTRYFVETEGAKDNLVLGADFILRLFKQRLEIFSNYGLAFYTRSINDGPITKEQLDDAFGDVPISPESFSRFIVVNTSFTPLYPSGEGILNSSALDAGFRLKLPTRFFTEYLQFTYDLQGANYYSMGNVLLGSPRQGFSIVEKLALLANRLVVSAEFSRYGNNFDNAQSQETVSQRLSGRIDFFYSQTLPGFSVGYTYNSSTNTDTAFGFSSGVHSLNLATIYRYRLGAMHGAAHLFGSWSGIGNQWKVNTFDSVHTVGPDTSVFTTTGVYGVSISANPDPLPFHLSGSFLTNVGNDRFLKMYLCRANARYPLAANLLTVHGGIQAGGRKTPLDTKYWLHARVNYGAELSHRSGHMISFGGYATSATRWDLVNTLSYQWRF